MRAEGCLTGCSSRTSPEAAPTSGRATGDGRSVSSHDASSRFHSPPPPCPLLPPLRPPRRRPPPPPTLPRSLPRLPRPSPHSPPPMHLRSVDMHMHMHMHMQCGRAGEERRPTLAHRRPTWPRRTTGKAPRPTPPSILGARTWDPASTLGCRRAGATKTRCSVARLWRRVCRSGEGLRGTERRLPRRAGVW